MTAVAVPESPLARVMRVGPFTRRTAHELLYLAVATVTGAVASAAVYVTVVAGPFVAVTVVGIPVVALLVVVELRLARRLAAAQRGLVRRLLGERVMAPPHLRTRPGLWGWLRSSLADADGWRAVAYLVITFPLKVAALWVTAMGWFLGVSSALYPLWWAAFSPRQVDASGRKHQAGVALGQWFADTVPKALLVAVFGVGVLWAVPWIARAVAMVDRAAVRWLLGPRAADRRVAELEERRAHVIEDSAATLRRVERDLHDGTQARLVALAMQLDQAREHLAGTDPTGVGGDDGVAAARTLLDTAHRNATDAIVELRDVTRSIHPPALDVGLDTALATLAARSAVPVHVRTSLPQRPAPAVETIAYFCVAELLTNVAKHSGARTVWVDAVEEGARLRLRVMDDGAGGATVSPGHGVAGLVARVADVDGRLAVDSPPGGPTIVTVDLPVSS